MANKIIDGVEIYPDSVPANSKTHIYTKLGWVAGLIYSDGHEWLFGPNGCESLYKDDNDAKIWR